MAAILTDIITTPLFKLKTNGNELIKDNNGIPVMDKDTDGSLILNSDSIDSAIAQGSRDMQKFSPA